MNRYVGVKCPTCGADNGVKCRATTTGRTTDTHKARFEAQVSKIRLPPVPEVCSCGSRFDGDNLCMISACEQEA